VGAIRIDPLVRIASNKKEGTAKMQFRQDILKLIEAAVPTIDTNIEPSTRFEDMGIDSLDMLTVVDSVETHFGFTFSDQDFERLKGLADLEAIVSERVADGS
jgi:acyl carrier protein